MMTPAELYYALQDFEETHFLPSRNICEAVRLHARVTYNSAFGRKKKDMIIDPKELFEFGWERVKTVKIQTVDEMKSAVLSIAKSFGVKKRKNE